MTVNASRLLRHVGACWSARQRSLLELLSSSLLMLDQLLTFMLETHSCHILISWLAAVGLQFSCSQRIFSLSLNLLNIPHFIVFIDFSFISFFKSSLILYDWQTCLPVIVFIDLFALIFASYSLYCRHHDQQTNLQIDEKKKKISVSDVKSVIMSSCVRHTLLLTLRFIWATLWWMKHHVDIHVIDWSVCSLEAYWLIQEGPLHSLRSYGMINNLESYLMKKHFYLTRKLRHHEQRFLILNWFVLLK